MVRPISSNKNIDSEFSIARMRPCQWVCVASGVTAAAYAALGLVMGAGGVPLLVIGTTLGYFSYNTYQVLTNIENLDKNRKRATLDAAIKTAGQTLHKHGSWKLLCEAHSGDLYQHTLCEVLARKTICFEFGVNYFASILRDWKSKMNPLDVLDEEIWKVVTLKA